MNVAEPVPIRPIVLLDGDAVAADGVSAARAADDPAAVILTCANCGAAMDERKCKLICRCGYFLSCSDYY
jgi:hypothetical protein